MRLFLNKPLPEFTTPVAIDIETSGLDPYQHRMLSIAVSDGTDVWVLLDFYGFDSVKALLENPDVIKIAHHAGFEHKWFKQKLGVDTVNWHDTMLTEKVIATDDTLPMSLDELLARHLAVTVTKETRKSFEDHPGFVVRPVTNEQLEYIVNDVLYLNQLCESQMRYVDSMDLLPTYTLEHRLIPAVAELELNGVVLDFDLWAEQVVQFYHLAEQAEITMREIIGPSFVLHVPAKKKGVDIIKDIPCADINLNSTAQLKQVFIERFNHNTDTTNAAFLDTLAEDTASEMGLFASLLLRRRGYIKRIGYAYEEHINPVTGRIHPSYHQMGARTGRFSCSNPNLQQVPRPIKGEPNMRHVWTADSEDYVIIRADYSQQEPRVMAQLCGDPAMIDACNKEDVYLEFGKHIYGHEIQKGSPERHVSKTFVLAVGYGAGAEKLSKASGADVRTCQDIKNKIRGTFPIMAKYGDKMYSILMQYGFVETAIGRRRYLDPNFTQAVNTPVQGTAADMFKLSLAKIYETLTDMKKHGMINSNTRVWNLVHDEIEVHCHRNEVDVVLPLVKKLMEDAGYEICPDVLHVAEAEWGYRWDK